MDALVGTDEDDHIVERLLDVDSSGKNRAVAELQFNSIVQEIGVQRQLHQLHTVTTRGPANTWTIITLIMWARWPFKFF